jgi:transposase, IS5 family
MMAIVGLKITGPIPDESTILKFRHLLESHGLGTKLFEVINQHLADQGLMLKEGTILDASIIAAPSSTKNQTGTRDPPRCTRRRRVIRGTLG